MPPVSGVCAAAFPTPCGGALGVGALMTFAVALTGLGRKTRSCECVTREVELPTFALPLEETISLPCASVGALLDWTGTLAAELAGGDPTPLAVSFVSDLVFPSGLSILLIEPGPAVNQPVKNDPRKSTTATIAQVRHCRRIRLGPAPAPTPGRWPISPHDLELRSVGAEAATHVLALTGVDVAFGDDVNTCARSRVTRSEFTGRGGKL